MDALPALEKQPRDTYTAFAVGGRRFGYFWPRTHTVGLKQTLSEQQALVAERPDVFEEQYQSGGFGWVVVYLAGIELDELTELVFEAWRLTAPEDLIAEATDPARSARTRNSRTRNRRTQNSRTK
ncbi:MmcQ/YjbR family DNA-binding protein [Lentzea sp. NBRC 105346]|uniref:MmcQ/YjbR family DNA-binding protein n=1 Tax=Lentzea sp. NBRC 105346 TaxID=3032205 RepID=UPI0025533C18|nr:MmcQ/YjbR family DNA-binding protein [Lentzea sp. NBRC 105346]